MSLQLLTVELVLRIQELHEAPVIGDALDL